MDEFIEEEMTIAEEQDAEGTSLNSHAFLRPISELRLLPVICIDVKHTIGDAIALMQDKKIGSLVITKNKELVGIFTERDILMRVIGIIEDWKNTSIAEVMTRGPQTLMEQDELAYVLNNMHLGGFRHIPIVDKNDIPVSMVSIKDVVNWILDQFPKEIDNLTGEPFRGRHEREGA